MKDSGLELISPGLESPHCTLETLRSGDNCFLLCLCLCVSRLSGCQVTEEGCSSLASALRSNPSHLKELDLSYNHPGDLGVKLLSANDVKIYVLCFFLRLIGCNLSERSCEALASVLSSQSSTLIEVDLSNNNLQDSGVKLICRELKSRHCTLRTLRSGDYLFNLGVKLLSALKEDPQCGLETLRYEETTRAHTLFLSH
uniref:SPRY-associated domain-containing protein n=1 Tax=Lates calcarifer TaxID=8187 RepID=A0A4W6FW16_LATCA